MNKGYNVNGNKGVETIKRKEWIEQHSYTIDTGRKRAY